jgi:hypothetical protein
VSWKQLKPNKEELGEIRNLSGELEEIQFVFFQTNQLFIISTFFGKRGRLYDQNSNPYDHHYYHESFSSFLYHRHDGWVHWLDELNSQLKRSQLSWMQSSVVVKNVNDPPIFLSTPPVDPNLLPAPCTIEDKSQSQCHLCRYGLWRIIREGSWV